MNETDAVPSTPEAKIAASFDALLAKGQRMQRAQAELNEEIAALTATAQPSGAVVARFDDLGLVASIDIDPLAREALTPEALMREVNLALAAAAVQHASKPIDFDRYANGTEDLAAISARLRDVLSSEDARTPTAVVNDLGTVTVSACLGTISTVECSASWLASASTASIAEELVRVCRTAMLQTDLVGRFTDRSA